jgi:hypothetical protein
MSCVLSKAFTAVYSGSKSVAMAFCQKYLQDYGGAPLSTIRYWLHEFSVIVKNTPRPALVWWREDTILLFGHSISFPFFKLQLRKKLLQLEQFILGTILFGMYSMDELEAKFGISRMQDNGDEKSIGYGIIADISTPGMDNTESKAFFDAIFKRQHLGLQSDQDGRILFDKKLALQWITNIDDAMRQFFPISHNTTISGRGTEAESLRPANNNIGRRNVIFDPEAGTGAYDADYHKGQERTGIHKHILRHMPYEVFRILYILVRIVRPIEFFFVCRAFVPFDGRARVRNAYANHIFASFGAAWNTTTMSSSLEAFFKDVAGFPMGLRQNRHFSVALQRRYIDYGAAKSGSAPTPEQLALGRTLNHLRGHEKEVGDANYAREGKYGSSSVDERQNSRFLSELWHKALGFPTSYSEVMAREVVEVVTHRVVKNIKNAGALKKLKKMAKKPRSSPRPHPAPKAAIMSPLRKMRVARKIYFQVDSESGEEFDFGDGDTSESEGSDSESGRMMVTASKQSGQVKTALQGQQIPSSSSHMVSEGSKKADMQPMFEKAQTAVPRVATSRPMRLIPLHGSEGNTIHEEPTLGSRAGQTGGSGSRRSERVAKRLEKKVDHREIEGSVLLD